MQIKDVTTCLGTFKQFEISFFEDAAVAWGIILAKESQIDLKTKTKFDNNSFWA